MCVRCASSSSSLVFHARPSRTRGGLGAWVPALHGSVRAWHGVHCAGKAAHRCSASRLGASRSRAAHADARKRHAALGRTRLGHNGLSLLGLPRCRWRWTRCARSQTRSARGIATACGSIARDHACQHQASRGARGDARWARTHWKQQRPQQTRWHGYAGNTCGEGARAASAPKFHPSHRKKMM